MQTRQLGPEGPVVTRIGFGAMHLSLAGRPSEDEGIRVFHAALDSGITLLDTANAYCLDDTDTGHNERLIARAIATWSGNRDRVLVATKGGCVRPNGAWTRDGRPAALRSACEASLRALGRESIGLYQYHAPDPNVPLSESVGTLSRLRDEGKIRHIGLSNVSVKEIEEARAIVPIVSVQNQFSPKYRTSETNGVVGYCTENGIAFLPYSPFGGSRGATALANVGTLGATADAYGVSPHRLVLAWMLAKYPVFFPIPGSRRIESVRDCAAADALQLTKDDVARVEASFQ